MTSWSKRNRPRTTNGPFRTDSKRAASALGDEKEGGVACAGVREYAKTNQEQSRDFVFSMPSFGKNRPKGYRTSNERLASSGETTRQSCERER